VKIKTPKHKDKSRCHLFTTATTACHSQAKDLLLLVHPAALLDAMHGLHVVRGLHRPREKQLAASTAGEADHEYDEKHHTGEEPHTSPRIAEHEKNSSPEAAHSVVRDGQKVPNSLNSLIHDIWDLTTRGRLYICAQFS
jgi:hypothetical protein